MIHVWIASHIDELPSDPKQLRWFLLNEAIKSCTPPVQTQAPDSVVLSLSSLAVKPTDDVPLFPNDVTLHFYPGEKVPQFRHLRSLVEMYSDLPDDDIVFFLDDDDLMHPDRIKLQSSWFVSPTILWTECGAWQCSYVRSEKEILRRCVEDMTLATDKWWEYVPKQHNRSLDSLNFAPKACRVKLLRKYFSEIYADPEYDENKFADCLFEQHLRHNVPEHYVDTKQKLYYWRPSNHYAIGLASLERKHALQLYQDTPAPLPQKLLDGIDISAAHRPTEREMTLRLPFQTHHEIRARIKDTVLTPGDLRRNEMRALRWAYQQRSRDYDTLDCLASSIWDEKKDSLLAPIRNKEETETLMNLCNAFYSQNDNLDTQMCLVSKERGEVLSYEELAAEAGLEDRYHEFAQFAQDAREWTPGLVQRRKEMVRRCSFLPPTHEGDIYSPRVVEDMEKEDEWQVNPGILAPGEKPNAAYPNFNMLDMCIVAACCSGNVGVLKYLLNQDRLDISQGRLTTIMDEWGPQICSSLMRGCGGRRRSREALADVCQVMGWPSDGPDRNAIIREAASIGNAGFAMDLAEHGNREEGYAACLLGTVLGWDEKEAVACLAKTRDQGVSLENVPDAVLASCVACAQRNQPLRRLIERSCYGRVTQDLDALLDKLKETELQHLMEKVDEVIGLTWKSWVKGKVKRLWARLWPQQYH